MADFIDYRLFYSKINRAKYIPHLDFMRAFERAFVRSKLPLWWTEGFNPHLYLTFALPLSVGVEGSRESVDFRLTKDVPIAIIKEVMSKCLPADVPVIAAERPVFKATEIASAEYSFVCDDVEKAVKLLESERIIVSKKTKKGISSFNLKEHIKDIKIVDNTISLTLPAGGTLNLNISLATNWLEENGAEIHSIKRTKIFTTYGKEFL